MPPLPYRIVGPGLAPRRTELPVPGWAGEPEPRRDGSAEHAWQCTPFSEGARYGFEVLYPFEMEMVVRKEAGRVFAEAELPPHLDEGLVPAIVPAGERFYLFVFTLDLKPPPGFAIRTEPHPRFYTDLSGEVPIAIPGLIRMDWWPMASTIVFKSPPEGGRHVFRPGEPFVQFIVVPEAAPFDLEPMDEETAAERELQARRITDSRGALAAGSAWTSSSGIDFDGAYRHLARAAKARDAS